jgi:5-dehydro-2-deoxygluconokinase
VGVDLYPEQSGVPLKDVATFAKSLGGTATNVAVGAARLGHRTAVLTKVGPDGFGDYVREALAGFGVDASYVGTAAGLQTPVVFCELNPPEDPPLTFYRAPDRPGPRRSRRTTCPGTWWPRCRSCWVTGTGVSVEPARTTQLDDAGPAAAARAGIGAAGPCLDLDWRPMFWPSPEEGRAEYDAMLDHVTVVVGNRAEVEVAVGTSDPHEAAPGCSAAASSWRW